MMMLKATPGHEPKPEPSATPTARELPHNIEAEQALLGALLLNNAVLDRIGDLVVPADFFDPLHGEIFSNATAMIQAGKLCSPVTIKTYFEHSAPLARDMTVAHYLGRLAVNATTTSNAADYARTVHDLAVRRALILIGEDIVAAAQDSRVDMTPESQIEAAERELTALAERRGAGDDAVPLSTALDETIARIEASMQRGGQMAGLSTGLVDLDRKLGGMSDGGLYIGAGRPGMGKTAFVVGIAWHAARNGVPVDFYSLEMPRDQITERILSAETDIAGDRLRRGDVNEHEFVRVMEARDRIRHAPLMIDHRGGITIGQLAARARRQKRRHGTRLIVVDYLQLMAGSGLRRGDNRVNEITEITTGLKALAKELHLPILALSQLSRGVETRENKRPQLSDLRESGSIEQDADAVMFLYREEYYLDQSKPPETDFAKFSDWETKMAAVSGKAEVILAKNRTGPTALVEVAFDGKRTRFSNLARQDMTVARHD